jgi:hypothetical protein
VFIYETEAHKNVEENKIFRFNFSPFYRCGANLDDGAHFVILSMNSSSRSSSMKSIKTFSAPHNTRETSSDGNMDYAVDVELGWGEREICTAV